ncbi:cytochrome P450 [uncultured Roseobacter sp.]|uniref:cytochrome P450 n=1 Tax=uncultured Roseobacter sp. TaxID=114847 RepID=UPI00260F2B43|nr:cytochrome P450 [uncultured Roseobacter sp.]
MNHQNQTFPTQARLINPASLTDAPHKRLAELRQETPVVQLGPNQYLVLQAAHVTSLLTDPGTRQIEGRELVALNQVPDGMTARFIADIFLLANGEAHRQKRGLFARSFAHRAMKDLRTEIRAAADALIAGLPRGESFDFVDRLAARVPADIIAAILGLPKEDTRHFAQLVYKVSLAFVPIYPHDRHDMIESATTELFDYVEGQMKARRTAPRDDLLSGLVADWDAKGDLSFDSLIFQVVGMIIAGSDTTRGAFAMLCAMLLQRPADWRALCDDHSLIPGAVSEGLRFEPSVATIPRVTTVAMTLGGIEIPAGAFLRLSTMSAMRDAGLYTNPDDFDIRRTDHPRLHLVFGLGPHRCLGEMLARIEMEESLAALLAATPEMELLSAPDMLGFGGLRQITPMTVRIPCPETI